MDLISLFLIIGATIISLGATLFIKWNYKKYKQENLSKKMTGYDVAREILDKNNLSDVLIFETDGELSDHYDPSNKTIKLSHDIYHGSTIAAAAVAAHECGHAIQDKNGYTFLRFRNKIIPLVNLSSKAGYVAIMVGIIFNYINLIWVGIAFEVIILLFQLITLPVEFDASKRALVIIKKLHIVNNEEHSGAKKMLTSAALTYVAGVLSTLLEILRLVLVFTGRDD